MAPVPTTAIFISSSTTQAFGDRVSRSSELWSQLCRCLRTGQKKVGDDTVARLEEFYIDREIRDIVWLVASEHIHNLTNIGLGVGSDGSVS